MGAWIEQAETKPASDSRRRPAKAAPIRVVLADRHPVVISGLERIFSEDPRFRVVAVAADGERFVEAVDRLSFHVGVVGWIMPYLDGRGVLQALRDRTQTPRIVIYADDPSPDVPGQAMALGAAGFCSNSAPAGALLETVAAVADGRMVFPYLDVRTLDTDPFVSLTQRERELLSLLRAGRPAANIAADLGISVNTVKFHLKNLYGKLGVHNRTQAVNAYLSAQVDGGRMPIPAQQPALPATTRRAAERRSRVG
ncbi:MAG: response regulator transcription factor [Alphaproteobacteria bacterium]|nr:response regulator transcription factor [Alphaproteobacteria bacterium]